MRKTTYILSSILLSAGVSFSVAACEYHSGFGGPFQSKWNNYTQDQSYMDESYADQTDDNYQAPPPAMKKKPVFSKAATQASNVAKARIERRSKAEQEKAAIDAMNAATSSASR